MLAVHTSHAIQEVSLQTQGDRSTGRLLDGIAGPGDVDVLDYLAVQLAAGRVVTEVGDEPGSVSALVYDGGGRGRCVMPKSTKKGKQTYHTVATPY